MRKNKILGILCIVLIVLATISIAIRVRAPAAQYLTEVSYDFLSADELGAFKNGTLAGDYFNKTLTTAEISAGKLNITNNDAYDAYLAIPKTLYGYAEITLDKGEIFVFTNWNGSKTTGLNGYVIKKDSSGVSVYSLNDTSKKLLASLATSASTLVITVDPDTGKFRVDTSDGTGIYEGTIGDAILALGAEPNGQGIFDTVKVYRKVYASTSGEQEVNLGTKTITSRSPVEFSYDLSGFQNIQTVTLVVEMSSSDDHYLRYFAVTVNGQLVKKSFDWDGYAVSMGGSCGYVLEKGTFKADITSYVTSSKTGTIKVAISTAPGYTWTVSVKLIVTAQQQEQQQNQEQQEETVIHINPPDKYQKYLVYGLGALVLFLMILLLIQPGGRRRRRW